MFSQLALISSIAAVHLLAVMSPGPDFLMTVRNSLTYSRRTGIWTAVGFGFGILVHIAYCAAGLAIIISQSILLFNTIKLLGAFYLVYIGYKSLRAKPTTIDVQQEEHKKDISAFTAIKMGFLTNVLNPKATLFFLSLFTFVISPGTPAWVIATASAVMFFNQTVWFSLVAIFLTQKNIRNVFSRFEGVLNKIFGTLLIALGIKVAMTK